MVPQQIEVTATSTQQTEVPASRPPVETTPVPDMDRTRTSPADDVAVIFDGDNRTCTICQEEFEDGERVRLRCRHIFHSECWMSAMVKHGAPLESDDDPDCPNCRGQGTIIALWNYIDPSLVTRPGATNLWTGDNTWSDLMLDLDNNLDNDLPDLMPPDELINHSQSNPEQTVEPDPRQAFQAAPVERTTNRGRRNVPIYRQMETPTNSRAESA